MSARSDVRLRTVCTVPGHGTRCEVAAVKGDRYPRVTVERLALEFEQVASEVDMTDRKRQRVLTAYRAERARRAAASPSKPHIAGSMDR